MLDKRAALITYFKSQGDQLDDDDVSESSWDNAVFEGNGGTWLVCTDDEADQHAKAYIRESLWAFNPKFLAAFTGLPEEVFKALQPLCEDANEAIEKILHHDFDDFADEAIAADGRGHFLSPYDGEEIEFEYGAGRVYIYRFD